MRNIVKIKQRRDAILSKLMTDGIVYVNILSEELNVTPATIRTDLETLEQGGVLTRIQGGAVPISTSSLLSHHSPSAGILNTNEKTAIANMVADQVKDGDVLFINSGTTMKFVANALKTKKNLNIVTNSIDVALNSGSTPNFRVILLGGEINSQHRFIHGNIALTQLEGYHADVAILALNGISGVDGLTTFHPEEVPINNMMMQHATRTIIAADHTKIGHTGFTSFGDFKHDITLVTDNKANEDTLNNLTSKGIHILKAYL